MDPNAAGTLVNTHCQQSCGLCGSSDDETTTQEASCSASSECGEGGYCNFDDETSGECELCEEVGTTCAEEGFETTQGLDECVAACEADDDVTTTTTTPAPGACFTGYVVDTTCLNQGFFFDNTDANPLLNPEVHSFHCLLDVA